MIFFALALLALTFVVLGVLLSPLFRQTTEGAHRIAYDMVVYRDQLAELDKDIARGVLTPEQAEAARAEIYRRMLAAEDAEEALAASAPQAGGRTRGKMVLGFVLFLIIPLSAGFLYTSLGSPELPGKPYAERKNSEEFALATEAEKWEAQLAIKPNAEGFKSLADTYFALRRYQEAVTAYQKVIEMNAGTSTIWSEFGEAIALAHDDMVVPKAHAAFVKALQLDPQDARARFYLGLAETQIHEYRRAVAIWQDLEKDSAPDAAWLPMLKEHIASFAKEGGFDPATVPPAPASLASPHDAAAKMPQPQGAMLGKKPHASAPEASPSSTADQASAIMAMKPEDQSAFIRQMVDRLAAKMKANPNDLEGWQRLATAYRVLGETDKAKEAERKAEALRGEQPEKPYTNGLIPTRK